MNTNKANKPSDVDIRALIAGAQAEHEEKVRGIQAKVSELNAKLTSPVDFAKLFQSHTEQSKPLNDFIVALMEAADKRTMAAFWKRFGNATILFFTHTAAAVIGAVAARYL